MEFSRQEYWSGVPFPTPEDLPNSGIKPTSLVSPELAGKFFTTSTTWEALGILWPSPSAPFLLRQSVRVVKRNAAWNYKDS